MRTAILCALTLSAAPKVGVRLDMETVDPKGASGERRLDLQGNKVRIDLFRQEATASGGVNRIPEGTTIFDGTEMFIIDHRSKTYVVVDPGQVKSQSERMKKPGGDSGKFTFKKGSGTDKAAGFACSNYVQSRDGVERGTACIASWKTGPLKKEDLGGLLKFAQTMGLPQVARTAMVIDPDDWPGFPLSSQSNDGQSLRLKSATRTTLPDNEFQPPADYTRREMP